MTSSESPTHPDAPQLCAKCGQPQSHPHHDWSRWPGRLTTGHPAHGFVQRQDVRLDDLTAYRHPDAPRAGGETPDSRRALDLEATLNLLRELADEEHAAICGDPHCPCGQAAKREGLLRDLVEHLSAPPSLRSSLSDGATDENLKDLNWLIDYSVRDGRDRITLSIDQARYFAARLALLARHRDGERWHATEDDLPMMLNLADECEVWGNTAWATRLREIALNGESFESFQSRRGPSPERASK